MREALDRIGDAVVVSGGGGLWTVHVHTDDADAAVDAGTAVGRPHRIRVTDIAGHEHNRVAAACAEGVGADHVVLVVLGKASPALALRDVFADAGVHVLEHTDGLADDICELAKPKIAVLAETPAVDGVRAAEPRVNARGVELRLVAAGSLVQLLAAAAVHDPQRCLTDDAVAMAQAAAATRHAEIRPHPSGERRLIGLIEGEQPLESDEAGELAGKLLDRIVGDDTELVTVVGEARFAAQVARRLRETRTSVEVTEIAVDAAPYAWLGVE